MDCISWYRGLWPLSSDMGDRPDVISAKERDLGIAFPELLRTVLAHTGLRTSEMVHLETLETMRVEDRTLVIAREQQDTFAWGVPLEELAKPAPAMVANPLGAWQDEGVTLEEFLHFFALVNRPYTPPFVIQPSAEESLLDAPPWIEFRFESRSTQHTVWTTGEAVYDGEALGARDGDALARASDALDIDLEVEDVTY